MTTRRLLLTLLVAAAWLATAAPAPGPGSPAGRAPLIVADLLGDDVFDAADAATGDLASADTRALPAKLVRVTGAHRTHSGPLSFTLAPGVAASPAPARSGWLATSTESLARRLASGIAGIRAPPASSI